MMMVDIIVRKSEALLRLAGHVSLKAKQFRNDKDNSEAELVASETYIVSFVSDAPPETPSGSD